MDKNMIQSQNITAGIEKIHLTDKERYNEKGLYRCCFPGCLKAFGKRSRLTQHERIHTGERPFKCSHADCDKSYTRNFHLTRHIAKTHYPEELIIEEYLSCDVCKQLFSNKYSLKKHKKIHETCPYNCSSCGKSFRKQHQFQIHLTEHTGAKQYECDHPGCSKVFSVASRLKKHSEIHIPDRYKCYHENCSKVFNGFNQYRKHLCYDHVHVCIECNKKFNTNRLLRKHLKTHEEKEVFSCPIAPCNRCYSQRKNLKVHIQTAHDPNFQGFQCNNCNKCCASKQKLNEHQKVHSPTYHRGYKSNKPRKPRKDKGTRRRSIYSVLSGYDDSKERAETSDSDSSTDQSTQNEPTTTNRLADTCAAITTRVASQIITTLERKSAVLA